MKKQGSTFSTLKKETRLPAELVQWDIFAPKPITVCFVCTGNTCRSPMAAAALNHLGKGKYKAFSAGLSVCAGDRIAENAVKALKKAGIPSTLENPYAQHDAVEIDDYFISLSDLVFGLTTSHTIQLLSKFPDDSRKILSLPYDNSDPFMYGEDVYDSCLKDIIECIKIQFDL